MGFGRAGLEATAGGLAAAFHWMEGNAIVGVLPGISSSNTCACRHIGAAGGSMNPIVQRN